MKGTVVKGIGRGSCGKGYSKRAEASGLWEGR